MSIAAAAIIGGLGAAGSVASAAIGSKGSGSPALVNTSETRRDQLEAEVEFAPQFLENYLRYQPQYAQADFDIQRDILMGTPGETRTLDVPGQEWVEGGRHLVGMNYGGQMLTTDMEGVTEIRPGVYQWDAPTGRAELNADHYGVYEDRPGYWNQIVNQEDYEVAPREGLLSLMRNTVMPEVDAMQVESATRQRTGEIADVQNLGPQAFKALRDYNPDQTAMRDELYRQRMEELETGGRLTQAELRERQQAVRGAQAARGMGYGPTDAYTEAMQMGAAFDNRRQRVQAAAADQIGLDQGLYGDVFQQILGRGSGQVGVGRTIYGDAGVTNGNAGPKSFLPNDSLSADVAGYNANAINASNIAAANNRAALTGAGIGAAGNLFGSALSNPSLFNRGGGG